MRIQVLIRVEDVGQLQVPVMSYGVMNLGQLNVVCASDPVHRDESWAPAGRQSLLSVTRVEATREVNKTNNKMQGDCSPMTL